MSYYREIEKRWRKGEFILITSPLIIDEINRVLHLLRIQHKYHLSEPDVQAFILALMYHTCCSAGRLVLKGAASDPGNDKIISCAVEAMADFIVAGDKKI